MQICPCIRPHLLMEGVTAPPCLCFVKEESKTEQLICKSGGLGSQKRCCSGLFGTEKMSENVKNNKNESTLKKRWVRAVKYHKVIPQINT